MLHRYFRATVMPQAAQSVMHHRIDETSLANTKLNEGKAKHSKKVLLCIV